MADSLSLCSLWFETTFATPSSGEGWLDGAFRCLALVLLLSLSGLWARIAQADPPPPADSQDPLARLTHEGLEHLPGSTITAAMIEKRIEEITAATDLDKDTKTRLLGPYQKSLSNLDRPCARFTGWIRTC